MPTPGRPTTPILILGGFGFRWSGRSFPVAGNEVGWAHWDARNGGRANWAPHGGPVYNRNNGEITAAC
eukprot:2279491-Lingulodinium_polyedra.AAC.1